MPARPRLFAAAVVLIAGVGAALGSPDRLALLLDSEAATPEQMAAETAQLDARLMLLGERHEFKRRLVNDLLAGQTSLANAAAELRAVQADDAGTQGMLANQFPGATAEGREAAHLIVLASFDLAHDPDRRRATLPRLLDEYRAAFGDTAALVLALERPAPTYTAPSRPWRGGRGYRWGHRTTGS